MRALGVILAILGATLPSALCVAQTPRTITVFREATIHRVEDVPLLQEPDGYTMRFAGQVVERTVDLPEPVDPVQSRRIIARVRVDAITSVREGRRIPNDPWNRLGSVGVLAPTPGGLGPPREVELVRFVTGYGGSTVFEQDITAFAPLLAGSRTLRLFVSSYSEQPGWRVSLELIYTDEGLGYRRPAFVAPLLYDQHVGAETGRKAVLSARVVIPEGLALPRLRILSTGHATDGSGANEFVTATHLLRIDGRIIARWRPWAEHGGLLRDENPRAGRRVIEGREIWASDYDRSGWLPGAVVEPTLIPVPELVPGLHDIELEIRGIRPATPDDPAHGYWVVSAVVVADEPWEEATEGPRR